MKKKVFKDFLKQRGLRFTGERGAILDGVFGLEGHFDPEGLYLAMRRKGSRVSRASVYRTLPLMIEAGIVERVEHTGKHAHYERVLGRGHHDHMLCVSCGGVVEFYSEAIESLQEKLCEEHNFEDISHRLEILGYCGRCREGKGGSV